MSIIKVNPTLPLYSPNSSTWGYPYRGSSKSDSKDKCSSQSFQEIFQQKLERHDSASRDTPPAAHQVILNRRSRY